jgi:sarcosine oxidase subunit alpha
MTGVTAPRRLLPLHHEHVRLRARFEERDGWQQPIAYADPEREAALVRETVGLIDASALAKIALKGAQVEAALASAWPGEAAAPLHVTVPRDEVLVCRLAPDEALVLASPGEREALGAKLEQQSAAVSGCAHAIDVTSAQAAVRLAGPRARDLLRKCTSLDVRERELPNLRCAQAGLARVQALVVRDDLGDLLSFLVVFSRDYAAFVWEWLIEVGHEFGVAPFGLAALELLRPTSGAATAAAARGRR